jgi:hypothetical protein
MVESPLGAARELIEGTLRGVGLSPDRVLAKDEPGGVSWSLKRGSASVLVSLLAATASEAPRLRVAASVMLVPDDAAARSALFQRLLELNAKGLGNASFGLVGDRVIAVSERPAAGLDAVEVDQIIKHLSAVADTYDDRLVGEFGGKRAADA